MSLVATAAGTAAVVGVGLTASKMLYGGVSAWFDDDEAAAMEQGGRDVYAAQERIAGETQSLSYEKADLAIERAGAIKSTAGKTAGFGARKSMTNLMRTGAATTSKQGFASDQGSQRRQAISAGQVQNQYTNQIQNIANTYDFSKKSGQLAKDAADIAYEKDIGAAQKELNWALAEADRADKSFWEGMFG